MSKNSDEDVSPGTKLQSTYDRIMKMSLGANRDRNLQINSEKIPIPKDQFMSKQ